MTTFPISEVNALRERALAARSGAHLASPGWSRSTTNPMKLLRAFDTLRIKPGFLLRAYVLRAGGNGNGIVWAMPANSPFADPANCPKEKGRFLEPPRPPEALDDLMEVIEGDGTPWSYLSASIFAREVAEFGAVWHGCRWTEHTILGSDPWKRSRKEKGRRKKVSLATGKPEEWTWQESMPELWEPAFAEQGGAVTITFHTFTGLGRESIFRSIDEYENGSYRFKARRNLIANGSTGYVF